MTQTPLQRRQFLKTLSSGVLCSLIIPTYRKPLAHAQASGRSRFILYVHAGSWDGWAAGLLQPTAPNDFPKGAFRVGVDGGSGVWDAALNGFRGNPLIDKHYPVDQFVFHNYSNPLADLKDDLCLVTGNAESLGHTEAQTIRSTGAKILG